MTDGGGTTGSGTGGDPLGAWAEFGSAVRRTLGAAVGGPLDAAVAGVLDALDAPAALRGDRDGPARAAGHGTAGHPPEGPDLDGLPPVDGLPVAAPGDALDGPGLPVAGPGEALYGSNLPVAGPGEALYGDAVQARTGLGEAPTARTGLGERPAGPVASVAADRVPRGYHDRVDADGDGRWDPATYRVAGDGGVDVLVDLTGDGRPDFVGHDADADRRVDRATYDTDGDGTVDKTMYDDDGDGWLDRTVWHHP